MSAINQRKAKPKAKKPDPERWKKFDPSWMWERELPVDAASRPNEVILLRRRERR